MSLSSPPLRSGSGRRHFFALGVAAVAVGLLLPWWRNHTILRDFYDYGLVMAAVGRMALGEHPYVDFLTPIQTLHFQLACWAESVFGASYLSLTYANVVFIVGAFGGLTALLFRPLGRVVAVIVAAAVVAATATQHTIVWHNAMGVIWVAVVLWLTARPRMADESGTAWRLLVVWFFLWLLGMTKLTYLATGLAFASLMALRDGWLGLRSWRRVALTQVSYGIFGLVAPVVTEMLSTGATFGQWLHNVVLMPQSRAELLRAMGTLQFYLHTPHDYYLPLYFSFVGAWGLGVLALTGALAFWQSRGGPAAGRARVYIFVMLAGSWACGGVLLATNYDIAYLSGAAWLVFGTGLMLAMPAGKDGRVAKSARIVLGVLGVSLLLPAWQAAWAGTRALWGTSPLVRSELVATDGLPARYAYFYGMRIPAALHASMKAFAGMQDQLAAEGMPASAFYFGNATEWLVRAVPEARHGGGLPLWLRDGTTFGEPEARIMNHRFSTGDEIQAVVSMDGWDIWFHQTDWYLNTRFKRGLFGPLFNVYLRRKDWESDWHDPLTFALATGSTAYARDLTATEGSLAICLRPEGSFLGAARSLSVGVKEPLTRVRGEWVVRRIAPSQSRPSVVNWRVVAIGTDGAREILREGRIELAPLQQEKTATFDFAPASKVVQLELDVPPGEYLEAGFRALQTDYRAGSADAIGPCPIDGSLTRLPAEKAWAETLFATESLHSIPLECAALAIGPDEKSDGRGLMVHTPGQIWFRLDPRFKQLRGEFGLNEVAWTNPDALAGIAAKVVYYRPGRLEVLFAKEIRPREVVADRAGQHFEVPLPGEPGWTGLIFTSLNPPKNAYGQSWWRGIDAR